MGASRRRSQPRGGRSRRGSVCDRAPGSAPLGSAIRWAEFSAAAPELAAFAEQRIQATGIVLLGTNRADGWPRISPCEAYVIEGELMLGMMWQSKKALDLLRDPRITIATPQSDREPVYGDLKLYGAVVDVLEPERRRAYSDTLQASIDWRPPEPYHLFAADIERAGFISFGKEPRLLRWAVKTGIEVLRHPDAATGSGSGSGST